MWNEPLPPGDALTALLELSQATGGPASSTTHVRGYGAGGPPEPVDPPLWTEGASAWPHEREALAFVRTRLPNHEPYRAWTNVEFIAEDGSVNEFEIVHIGWKDPDDRHFFHRVK